MGPVEARVALLEGDVAARSAAARSLALGGELEDLVHLVEQAQSNKSSAVRLYAAAAAADVVSRYRGTPELKDWREPIESWIGRVDPAGNPSLLMLWSAFPDRTLVTRLLRMLRDPRIEVRAGAAVALRRMVLSSIALGFEVAEALVGETLQRKLPQDAVVELVRLTGEVGWTHLDDILRRLAGRSVAIREAVDEALGRNRRRADDASLFGYWVDLGVDVQQAGSASSRGYLAVVDGKAGTDTGPADLARDGGGWRVSGEPARLVFAAPPGPDMERVPALQTASRTWWRQEGGALVELLDAGAELSPVAYAAMQADIEALEGAVGARARMIAAWGAGELDEARVAIDALTDKKKPRQDLWFWRARIYADLGEVSEARAAVTRFLEKARAKHPLRERAETLQGTL